MEAADELTVYVYREGTLCRALCPFVSLSVVQELKLKNAGSWSSLASLAAVTQPSGTASTTSTVKKSTTAMSFELFKKAAKEKEERVSSLHTHWLSSCFD